MDDGLQNPRSTAFFQCVPAGWCWVFCLPDELGCRALRCGGSRFVWKLRVCSCCVSCSTWPWWPGWAHRRPPCALPRSLWLQGPLPSTSAGCALACCQSSMCPALQSASARSCMCSWTCAPVCSLATIWHETSCPSICKPSGHLAQLAVPAASDRKFWDLSILIQLWRIGTAPRRCRRRRCRKRTPRLGA